MDRKSFLRLGIAAAFTPLIGFPRAPAPAYAEGSKLAKPLPAMVPLGNDRVIAIGYANAVYGYEHVYPTLARAVKNMQPAMSTMIEWVDSRGKAEFNYAQIVRTPFGATGTEMSRHHYTDRFETFIRGQRKDALHSHLADVEQTLLNGKRLDTKMSGRYPIPIRLCGGVNCFKPGNLSLRPLRDLVLLTSRQAMDEDRYTEEYLGEFSLQVS